MYALGKPSVLHASLPDGETNISSCASAITNAVKHPVPVTAPAADGERVVDNVSEYLCDRRIIRESPRRAVFAGRAKTQGTRHVEQAV